MKDAPYKRSGRFLIAFLYISVTFCVMLPYIAPSVLMDQIMDSLQIGLDLAGSATTVVLAIAGIFFFVGSVVEDKIGTLNTIKLCMVSLSLGGIVTGFAANVYLFFIGRILIGIGFGLSVGLSSYISTWFQGSALSYVITFNTLGSALAMALSTGFSTTLADITNSWHNVFKIYAGVAIVFTILWFIFGKNSPEGEEVQKARTLRAKSKERRRSSLVLALTSIQIYKIAAFAILATFVDTARATYMPTYLITSRGVPDTTAYAASSIFSIVGMVGSLFGGVVASRIHRRKVVLAVSLFCYMLCGLGVTFLPNGVAIILSVALGFFFNIRVTSQSNLTIESCMEKDPTMITSAFALANGTGMLLTLFVAPIFTALNSRLGMDNAYRVFFLLCILGIFSILSAKETGKKRKAEPASSGSAPTT